MNDFNQLPPDERETAPPENGIVVPFDQLAPETLRALIEEYITRDWSDFGDDRHSVDSKVRQVMHQLKRGEAQIVFSFDQNSVNIVKT